ncbi:hypothetical protein EV421DRAFT_1744841 [Armillaria borealis]|uniref:Uncharacterized protein n=1 Tax=Armillaria borealis TaxID=47425 RepID=A0AA39IT16_9AGAR|nr:hypothetical protein EV421DRAFT_1744841 [Armillaria borealis]
MAPAKELSMRELYTSALPLSLIYGISEKLGFENDTTTALRDSHFFSISSLAVAISAQFTCEKRDAARQIVRERGHGKLDKRMFGVNEWCRVEETLPYAQKRSPKLPPWRAEAELSSSNRRRPGERRASNIASLFQSFYDFRALVQHRCLNIRKSAPPKTTRRKMLIYTWSLGRIHRDDKGDGTPTSGDQASGGTKKSSRRMESETFDGQKNSTSLPRNKLITTQGINPAFESPSTGKLPMPSLSLALRRI